MREQRAGRRVQAVTGGVAHALRAAGTAVAVAAAVVTAACGSSGDERGGEAGDEVVVVAVDRTGVADVETWSQEVAVQVAARAERAIAAGADRLEVIGIGSNTQQTARVATVDLTIEGNNEAKRDRSRRRVVEAAAGAAAEVANHPVGTNGTDIVAGLDQAAGMCRAPGVAGCSILLVSDLEDQRVALAPTTAEAVTAITPLMPDLGGVTVEATGLGASGAGAEVVARVGDAWTELLGAAGAADVRIARSL